MASNDIDLGASAHDGEEPSAADTDLGYRDRLAHTKELVQKGLPASERERLERCRVALDFYNMESWKHYDSYLVRENERPLDFARRPKETRQLVPTVIDRLCEHLYNPGPSREHPDAGTDAVLAAIYGAALANERLAATDVRATLHGAAAIQVYATGDPERPIQFYVYGGDELVVFAKPDDPVEPEFVLTLSPRLWELWTPESIFSWEIKKGSRDPMAWKPDGDPVERPNPLGLLPFAFFHNKPPVRDFWEGGIGHAITEANKNVDRHLSDIADGSRYYRLPTYTGRNLAPGATINLKPGVVNNLSSGDNGRNGPPEIDVVSAGFDVRTVREAVQLYVDDVLRDFDVPPGAVKLDAGESGISKVADSLPLLTRATKRQVPWTRYEQALAALALEVASAWYRIPADLSRPVGIKWPRLRLPIPIPEIEEPAYRRYDAGIASKIDLLMMLDGLTRTEAEAKLLQVQEDNASDPERQAAMSLMGGDPNVPVQQAGKEEGPGQGQAGGKAEAAAGQEEVG